MPPSSLEDAPPLLTSSKTGTFYFAFGSNLSAKQMSLRLPNSQTSSEPVALARLAGHRWIICERGYANVVALKRSAVALNATPRAVGDDEETDDQEGDTAVWGIIYNMHTKDEAVLDLYEGHDDARNPEPHVNPNVDERIWRPYLQGNWDYNKQYLNVSVTKWFRDPSDYGVDIDMGTGTDSQLKRSVDTTAQRKEDVIRVLVYVDELRTQPGEINAEYIGRMNRAIDESVALGLPERWVEQVMRKWVEKGVDVDDVGYVGTDRGYVESERTESLGDVKRRLENGGGRDALRNEEDKLGDEVEGGWDKGRVDAGTW